MFRYYLNPNQGDNSIKFFNRDLHGGHSEEHRREMEEVARRVFNEEYAKKTEELNEAIYKA